MLGLLHPVPGGDPTDGYGPRGYVPGVGNKGFHTGQDWAAPAGTPILAAHHGTITRKWWDGDAWGGWMVAIRAPEGYETEYAHMLAPSHLPIGQPVAPGDVLGGVGMTGGANGNHLHFNLIIGGRYVDPLPHIAPIALPEPPKPKREDDLMLHEYRSDPKKGGTGAIMLACLATGAQLSLPKTDNPSALCESLRADGIISPVARHNVSGNRYEFIKQRLAAVRKQMQGGGSVGITQADIDMLVAGVDRSLLDDFAAIPKAVNDDAAARRTK